MDLIFPARKRNEKLKTISELNGTTITMHEKIRLGKKFEI